MKSFWSLCRLVLVLIAVLLPSAVHAHDNSRYAIQWVSVAATSAAHHALTPPIRASERSESSPDKGGANEAPRALRARGGPPKDAAPRGRRVSSPFRGLGQYYDAETQLSCTRYRYWEAGTGRWLSADPLGISGGTNLLGFDGCPTIDVDPLGLACERARGGAGPKRYPDGSLRTPDGKFASPKGTPAPGTNAVDDFIAHAQKDGGFDVLGREIEFVTPFGRRRYDVVLRNRSTGVASGVEIKSSAGAFNRFDKAARQQFAADRWINMQGGAEAVGRFKGLEIESTIKMLWQAK